MNWGTINEADIETLWNAKRQRHRNKWKDGWTDREKMNESYAGTTRNRKTVFIGGEGYRKICREKIQRRTFAKTENSLQKIRHTKIHRSSLTYDFSSCVYWSMFLFAFCIVHNFWRLLVQVCLIHNFPMYLRSSIPFLVSVIASFVVSQLLHLFFYVPLLVILSLFVSLFSSLTVSRILIVNAPCIYLVFVNDS